MAAVWLLLLVSGIGAAAVASRRAVGAALDASDALGVSAGLIGVTVMAIGTDLPEIANSIVASLQGHGDLNVGDSAGSALTQITLVLAILMISAGDRFNPDRSDVAVAITSGAATVIALVFLAVLLIDGGLGRLDGMLLIGCWIAGATVVKRREDSTAPVPRPGSRVGRAVGRTLAWLAMVGAAATIAVEAFVELADRFGVPEFVASAVVLSLGTSLPELVVDWTAIRRGATALAIGDLFGSSLVDSTLSVGIGPVVRPIAVSGDALAGVLVIAVGCALATTIVTVGQRRRTIVLTLLGTYVAATAVLLMIAS